MKAPGALFACGLFAAHPPAAGGNGRRPAVARGAAARAAPDGSLARGRGPARRPPAPGARARTRLLDRLLGFFTDLGDPDWEKRRQLRLIERQLRSARQKLYDPRKSLALPGMAAFFHTLYRILAPAQALVGRAESSHLLRNLLIESAFSEAQKAAHARLQEEAISARAVENDGARIAAGLKEEVAAFAAGFDSQKAREVDRAYAHLMSFLDLVRFDFYFFLRKFDSNLLEGGRGSSPRFEAISAGYVVDDLRELWEIILSLDTSADWSRLLEVLRRYRDVEVVSREGWSRLLQAVNQLQRSRLLELIVKHAAGDPAYRPRPVVHGERIVDAYLDRLRTQVELTAQRAVKEERTRRIDALARAVFGSPPAQRLRHYSDRADAELRVSLAGGFTYAAALNYLLVYLQDHFDQELRPAVDLILIKGRWAAGVVSQHMSEALHNILELRDRLLKLDADLGDEGEAGTRLQAGRRRGARDRAALAQLRKLLAEINSRGREILVATLQSLVVLGRNLKTLIDDRGRARGELILNWRELEAGMGQGGREAMVGAYRRLFHLVRLMQVCIGG